MKQIFSLIILFSLSLGCFAQPKPLRSVEPLLNTIRVQTHPYNSSCPYYNYGDSVSSEPCLVGCVATAIEQLLSYYRYPDCLQDSIAGWETRNYSLPTVPSGSEIDWDDVADLSLWCGMIVRMNYGPSASAAGLWRAEEPLKQVFGYKTVRIVDRSMYSFDAWHRILQNELLSGRPVAYVGYNNVLGGHAFNIDGVDENGLYHCNWGEGEHHNGYFSLEHLCKYQPPHDETDWGRMVGYHANEYMLILHPDSVTDVHEPDTLTDFAHAVRVDTITFQRQITNRDYVLTDVTLTNISDDTLFHTYELILNSLSDTSLLEQCREVTLSAVKLFPGETRTQTVAGHYPATPGRWLVGLTFDGLEVPYSKMVDVIAPSVEQLAFIDKGVDFSNSGTAKILLNVSNTASSGVSGRLLYFSLYEHGSDVPVSKDYRFTNIPAGEAENYELIFNRLEANKAYVLKIGGWDTTIHTVSFTMPNESTDISIPMMNNGTNASTMSPWYDTKGRVVRSIQSGIFINNGRIIYYDAKGNN